MCGFPNPAVWMKSCSKENETEYRSIGVRTQMKEQRSDGVLECWSIAGQAYFCLASLHHSTNPLLHFFG